MKLGASASEQAASHLRIGKICKPHEIDGMRVVCRVSPLNSLFHYRSAEIRTRQLAREVLDITASHIRPGITTLELDQIVHELCIERNSYPSPLGYYRFPRSVCTSVNEVICHGAFEPRLASDALTLSVCGRRQVSRMLDRLKRATSSTST